VSGYSHSTRIARSRLSSTHRQRLPGREYRKIEAHYNYYRDYDPGLGRYIESDPIGLRGGSNTFGYVQGSPLASIDRPGLQACSVPKHDDDPDPCYERREREVARCYERYGPTFNWIVGACIERANVRWIACRHGQEGPPEWDDRDVNGWQPPKAPRGERR
jgi:RHS repeat-associated protein